jgi:hypothetical protein
MLQYQVLANETEKSIGDRSIVLLKLSVISGGTKKFLIFFIKLKDYLNYKILLFSILNFFL